MSRVTRSFYAKVATELTAKGHRVVPSSAYYAMCGAWQLAEGGNATHNPWNTTLVGPGSTDYNHATPPVQNYPTQAAGITATVNTLLDPRHSDLLAAIVRGADPYFIAVELDRARTGESAWGTDGALMAEVLHDTYAFGSNG